MTIEIIHQEPSLPVVLAAGLGYTVMYVSGLAAFFIFLNWLINLVASHCKFYSLLWSYHINLKKFKEYKAQK